MATATQSSQVLLSAEEFGRRPDPGFPEELFRGHIVIMPPPGARHGQVCAEICYILKRYAKESDLGHVLSNDAGVITERGPDSVRGPDVAYYSYARLPKGPLPTGYPSVPPDMVFEVFSPFDRWPKVLAKVAEYLEAGVVAVAVADPERSMVYLYDGERPVTVLGEADILSVPKILGDFQVIVGRFFE